jgi:subtilisin family serine protease
MTMKKQPKTQNSDGAPPPPEAKIYEELPSGPTGRSLVVLNPNDQKSLMRSLKDTAGITVACSSDFEGAAVRDSDLGDADALLLEHLNVAVVDADEDQLQSLTAAIQDESNPVLSVEQEEYVRALQEDEDGSGPPIEAFMTQEGRNYLLGYSEAVASLAQRLLGETHQPDSREFSVAASFADTAALTWGLQAVRVTQSLQTGAGIRIAMLDTGMDLRHPDFAGRSMLTASFVPGESVQDGHSHGTHCIGTACGPKVPPGGVRRYGVAHQATILVGKVLSDRGSGSDGGILAGINWAIQNKAAIISMSLGSPVAVGGTFKLAYEQAAQAALNNNCLIIAAAGNSGNVPVFSPANCPSIMAVGALDQNLQRASFSCIGINPNGGELNIAAPGVSVFSCVPMPTRYGFKTGTSMATPHVAGLAALWAQSTGLRGTALWKKLTSTAINIGQTPQTVGAGLSVAPRSRIIVGPFHPRLPFRISPRPFDQADAPAELATN